MPTRGLLIVNTGNGKGKTTAALGTALRTLGHGLPVCVIQFVKGTWKYGELFAAKQFGDLLDLHVMGKGFIFKEENIESNRPIARRAWDLAKRVLTEGRHHLIVLDELTYLVKYRLIPEDEILADLADRPPHLHVIVTGRGATPPLIELADLVTEMRDVKHPLQSGVKAQKGIEF